jgi:hypothetical protein
MHSARKSFQHKHMLTRPNIVPRGGGTCLMRNVAAASVGACKRHAHAHLRCRLVGCGCRPQHPTRVNGAVFTCTPRCMPVHRTHVRARVHATSCMHARAHGSRGTQPAPDAHTMPPPPRAWLAAVRPHTPSNAHTVKTAPQDTRFGATRTEAARAGAHAPRETPHGQTPQSSAPLALARHGRRVRSRVVCGRARRAARQASAAARHIGGP